MSELSSLDAPSIQGVTWRSNQTALGQHFGYLAGPEAPGPDFLWYRHVVMTLGQEDTLVGGVAVATARGIETICRNGYHALPFGLSRLATMGPQPPVVISLEGATVSILAPKLLDIVNYPGSHPAVVTGEADRLVAVEQIVGSISVVATVPTSTWPGLARQLGDLSLVAPGDSKSSGTDSQFHLVWAAALDDQGVQVPATEWVAMAGKSPVFLA